jgi:mxaA protein
LLAAALSAGLSLPSGLTPAASTAVPAGAPDPSIDPQVQNPRAFGHFIGDTLERRIEVAVPHPYVLSTGKLPMPARVNPWLELTRVAARATDSERGLRYDIDLSYQIVNSPTKSRVASIPGLTLRFVGGGRAFDRTIDGWPIAIAPLAASGTRVDLEALRPARRPMQIDGTAVEVRLLSFGSASAALFGVLALLEFGLPGAARRRRPFAAAHRALRALAKTPASMDRHHAALRTVHRAFDQTMGVRVFAEQLDEFLASHAHFREVSDRAASFFAASQREFFGRGSGGESPTLESLLALCREFEVRERRTTARRLDATSVDPS